ncbi:hypothetical protein BGZ63DRAFT_455688 [Mariannaea sp. PMI_226]|nr:hypothetical protein BGZ63DRAFT_455688 [Mariannaea sp. PMI_226]
MAASYTLLALAVLLLSVTAAPRPVALTTSNSLLANSPQSDWGTVQCTVKEIADASYSPDVRWAAVDSEHAWQAVTNSWNNDAPDAGQVFLPFPMMVSNFFHGPEHLNCQDIGDGTCNTMIQCSDTNHPAGYLIINSFVSIHQIHQNRYNSLNTALNLMQSQLGEFTNTFAPQINDGSQVLREILTSFAFIVGLGSAYSWNTIIKTAKIFSNDDWRGVSKDAFNSAITFAVSTARDHLPTESDIQNDLNSAMGTFVGKWMAAEADYVNQMFQGSFDTLSTLHGLLRDGVQGAIQTDTDLASLTVESQHIIYTKMIPAAWSQAPGNYHPFILATDNECNSLAEGDLKDHMDDNTAAQTHVCYDNKIFYVVTPEYTNNRGVLGKWKLNGLPGGTFDNLHGGNWGGVVLDDFVISSWDAYKLNGNKNGYQMPDNSQSVDGNGSVGDLIFEAGVRTPGFTTMNVCDIPTLKHNLQFYSPSYNNFPCHVA